MSRERRNFTSEFKARVALEAASGGLTLNEIAQKYEVHPNQVTQWKKEFKSRMHEIFDTKRGRKAADNLETEEGLYKKIGQLQVEVDWLKKKLNL